MANAITGVDLDQLHDVIEAKFRAQFPVFQLVQFYRDEEERKAPTAKELPALLLELTSFDIDEQGDQGTEQLPLIARFEARIIDTFNQRRAKINVRKLAAGLALYIFKNKHFTQLGKFGVGVSSLGDISEDGFFPELDLSPTLGQKQAHHQSRLLLCLHLDLQHEFDQNGLNSQESCPSAPVHNSWHLLTQ
jgi:hypothetical protein